MGLVFDQIKSNIYKNFRNLILRSLWFPAFKMFLSNSGLKKFGDLKFNPRSIVIIENETF